MSKAFDGENYEEPILKIGVNISIEVEQIEMTNETFEFESQGEANGKDWKEEVERQIGASIKNFYRTTEEN